jgi:sulfoxide reductase heme-binding subunit YedZ
MPALLSIRAAKVLVFVACLVPVALLAAAGLSDGLGANPIDAITDATGDWTLRFVLITLAVTPFRRLTGWNPIVRFRRMLGLFAFFYGFLHFSTYIVLDQFFAWSFIWADIAKRPYITMGFLGFTLMVPLAITSTTGWIRRLGGRRWQQLHRLIYATAIAGMIHWFWLVKVVSTNQIIYAGILAVLLALRIWYAWKPKSLAPASTRPAGVNALRSSR